MSTSWSDSGGKDFEQVQPGSHIARCIRIVDLGTRKREYPGDEPKFLRSCWIVWELPNELIKDGEHAGKPFTVSEFYTSSLSKKANLRLALESWRGKPFTEEELKGFNPRNVLGAPCMLSVIHKANGKPDISAIMQVPKGMPVPPQVNPSVFFSLDSFDQSVYDGLTKGIKEMIAISPEYQALKAPKAGERGVGGNPPPDFDSDPPIPF